MAHCHGRILCLEHHAYRLTYDEGASHHTDIGSFEFIAVMLEELHARLRRARGKPNGFTRKHPIEGARRRAVHILGRIERRASRHLVKRRRQRAQHQAALNRIVRIHRLDSVHQLLLGTLHREHDSAHVDAQ